MRLIVRQYIESAEFKIWLPLRINLYFIRS